MILVLMVLCFPELSTRVGLHRRISSSTDQWCTVTLSSRWWRFCGLCPISESSMETMKGRQVFFYQKPLIFCYAWSRTVINKMSQTYLSLVCQRDCCTQITASLTCIAFKISAFSTFKSNESCWLDEKYLSLSLSLIGRRSIQSF